MIAQVRWEMLGPDLAFGRGATRDGATSLHHPSRHVIPAKAGIQFSQRATSACNFTDRRNLGSGLRRNDGATANSKRANEHGPGPDAACAGIQTRPIHLTARKITFSSSVQRS